MQFSVVIPTFNRADLIGKCLESLQAQTFRDFEVLVCDNGSTDNTAEVVRGFSGSLKIDYTLLAPSGGPSAPRNFGFKKAKGEWICLLDSDDWWTPDKLEVIVKQFANCDLIYHQLIKTDGEATFETIGGVLPFSGWEGFFVFGNSIPTSSVCFRRDLINKIGFLDETPALRALADADYWLRMVKGGARLRFVEKPLGYYFWKPGVNMSGYNDEYLKRNEVFFQKYEKEISSPAIRAEARALLWFRRAQVYFGTRRWKDLAAIPFAAVWNLKGMARKLKLTVVLVLGRAMSFASK